MSCNKLFTKYIYVYIYTRVVHTRYVDSRFGVGNGHIALVSPPKTRSPGSGSAAIDEESVISMPCTGLACRPVRSKRVLGRPVRRMRACRPGRLCRPGPGRCTGPCNLLRFSWPRRWNRCSHRRCTLRRGWSRRLRRGCTIPWRCRCRRCTRTGSWRRMWTGRWRCTRSCTGPGRRRALGRKPLVPSKRAPSKLVCKPGLGIGRWRKPRKRRRWSTAKTKPFVI